MNARVFVCVFGNVGDCGGNVVFCFLFFCFVCIYLSVRGAFAWVVCECVHKGFVCILKGLGILFVSLLGYNG